MDPTVSGNRRRILNLLAILAALWCAIRPAPAATRDAVPLQEAEQQSTADAGSISRAKAYRRTLRHAVDTALPSFLFIGETGSGVIISVDGFALTNDHVIGAAKSLRVRTAGGVSHIADVISTDPVGDIALLKIRGVNDLVPIAFGDSDRIAAGMMVIAVGNPWGLGMYDKTPSVSVGIISSTHRYQVQAPGDPDESMPAGQDIQQYADAIQTDAALNPGNSGGPLVTLDGKLIGINGLISSRFGIRANSGIGYAVPINQIKRFLSIMKKQPYVFHGKLDGVTITPASNDDIRPLISELKLSGENRAANTLHAAGIRTGDIIVSINNTPTPTVARALGIISSFPEGVSITITCLRGAERLAPVAVRLNRQLIPGKIYLGFRLHTRVIGLAIRSIEPNSVPAGWGLRKNDIIMTMDDRFLSNRADWLRAKERLVQAGHGTLTIRRADAPPKTLNVTVDSDFPDAMTLVATPLMNNTPPARIREWLQTVSSVDINSPAARGGLRPGDVITRINGVPVNTVDEITTHIENLPIGLFATFTIIRDTRAVTLNILVEPDRRGPADTER